MSVDFSSLSLDKALSMALRSEVDAENAYKKLQKAIKNFIIKDKLQFLIHEEKKHQKLVKAVFQKIYPGKDQADSVKSVVPRLSIALNEEMSVVDLIETAMEAEKTSEEFYDGLSEAVEDRGLQEILQYLASMEHSHYFLLKGEYELAMRDEQYTQRDEFQYDMVHVGP
jgi:rubrerythrin